MKTIDNMPFLSIAGIIISILVGFVSTYAQLKDPETGMALFVALLAMIILFFVVSYVIEQIRKRIGQQNKNSEDIKNIRKDLNNLCEKLEMKNALDTLAVRLSVLEQGKKGRY